MALEIRHFTDAGAPIVRVDGRPLELSAEELVLLELLCIWSKQAGQLTFGDAAFVLKGDDPNARGRLSTTLHALRQKIVDAGGDASCITTGPRGLGSPLSLSREHVSSDLRDVVEAAESSDWSKAASITLGTTAPPLSREWEKTVDRKAHLLRFSALLDDIQERSRGVSAEGPAGACASHVAAVLRKKHFETFGVTLVQTLVRDRARLRPFRVKDSRQGDPDALEHLLGCLEGGRNARWLVDGEPGSGKSILGLAVLQELCARFQDDPDAWPFPVFVDLRDPPPGLGGDIGSKEWTEKLLKDVSPDTDWRRPGDRRRKRGVRPVFLVDSAELPLRGDRIGDEREILSRPLFEHAICFCRSSYFDQRLGWLKLGFDRLQLASRWDSATIDAYVDQELGVLPARTQELARAQLIEWRRDPEVNDLCAVPLYIAMAVELAAQQRGQSAPIEDRVGLFERYMSWQMKRKEAGVPEKELRELLERIGWEFETDVTAAVPFTDHELFELVKRARQSVSRASVETLVANLKWHSVLTGTAAGIDDDSPIKFAHDIFGAHFAAARVAHVVCRRDFTPEAVTEHFAHFFPYEVSAFLREHFARLAPDRNQRLRNLALRRLKTAYASPTGVARSKVRIVREQIGYFLGSCFGADAHEFLLEQLHPDKKEDPWVRRGIAVGLAEAEIDGPLDDFVAELHAELERDQATIDMSHDGVTERVECQLRDMNIGFNRSFFGDQPLDQDDPARIVKDKGRSCANTVAGLTRSVVERRATRMALFTLYDLGTRAVTVHNLKGLEEALKSAPADFDVALRQLARGKQNWDEIGTVQALLQKAKAQR